MTLLELLAYLGQYEALRQDAEHLGDPYVVAQVDAMLDPPGVRLACQRYRPFFTWLFAHHADARWPKALVLSLAREG